MNIIKTIINIIRTFWESFISEDYIEQDFRKNYSIHYSCSNIKLKKSYDY